jgi:hypothetical protein
VDEASSELPAVDEAPRLATQETPRLSPDHAPILILIRATGWQFPDTPG